MKDLKSGGRKFESSNEALADFIKELAKKFPVSIVIRVLDVSADNLIRFARKHNVQFPIKRMSVDVRVAGPLSARIASSLRQRHAVRIESLQSVINTLKID